MRGRVSFTSATEPTTRAGWRGHAAAPSPSTCASTTSTASSPTTTTRRPAPAALDCDGLGERMELTEGTFNLLVAGRRAARRREMRVRAQGHRRAGRRITPGGFKDVRTAGFATRGSTPRRSSRRCARAGRARTRCWPPGCCASGGSRSWARWPRCACAAGRRGRGCARSRAMRASSRAASCAGLRGPERHGGPAGLPGRARRDRGLPGPGAGRMAPVPGAPGPAAADPRLPRPGRRALTVHNIRGEAGRPRARRCSSRHGTGVRAEITYGAPIAALARRRARRRRSRRLGRQLARLDRPAGAPLHARRRGAPTTSRRDGDDPARDGRARRSRPSSTARARRASRWRSSPGCCPR